MAIVHNYVGFIVGFGGLAAAMLLNQLIFQYRW